jgi:hypothetical protein
VFPHQHSVCNSVLPHTYCLLFLIIHEPPPHPIFSSLLLLYLS